MSTRIYVGNLPYSATSESLTDLFATYGEVTEAVIIQDRDTGRSKGFGFVQMADDGAAHTAIEQLNGTVVDDRTIRVSEAQARPERRDRPSNGGYRGQRW